MADDHAHISALFSVLASVLPLITFAAILFFAKKGKGSILALCNISISFLLSVLLFFWVWNKGEIHAQLDWFAVGDIRFTAGVLLNNLSVLMMVLISGIALLVHIYSLQYMKNDEHLNRYWAYLGLFCFSMLSLVIADNLLLVYMFWELVGFSSYLLIGFWFTRDTATLANKKAFIVNRIGDLGFLTGLMILFTQFKTLDIVQLFGTKGLIVKSEIVNGLWQTGVGEVPAVWLTVAGIALFFGAAAKSAQFPLHTWLPDAMEGPTSVSSLIHAATMVAAGVFLIARVYPIFDNTALTVITIVGTFTAFMAATIALVQYDIKKLLAFSTISQLGFMMVAMGTGAVSAGIFHLATHAFFKCLLFLAAGAVIHELHHAKGKYLLDFDVQDIRNMGGLKKYMQVTFYTMLVASMALAGLPFTSGFLSKDAILVHAFEWSDSKSGVLKFVPYVALITSWLTAFYIFRLIFMVFFKEIRLNNKFGLSISVNEAPKVMVLPLIILACFCLFPLFSLDPFSAGNSWLFTGLNSETQPLDNSLHLLIPVPVTAGSLIVIFIAYKRFANRARPETEPNSGLEKFLYNQWYFNSFYKAAAVNPITFISNLTHKFDNAVIDGIVNLIGRVGVIFAGISALVDRFIVDGLVNGAGILAKRIGSFTRHLQTGRVQHYLLTMLLVVLTFVIVKYFSGAI